MPVTKVLIVDDHPLFSMGLASLIATYPMYAVVGSAKNTAEALRMAVQENPSLVILDLNLGDENGMDLIPLLKDLISNVAILVLSMNDERYYSERIIGLGAHGYIMKDEAGDKIFEAIKTVMSGKIYLGEAERERLALAIGSDGIKDNKDRLASIQKLSNRQIQIFSLIGNGFGTIEISNKLDRSTKTVDTHKEHIKLKLNCASSQELRQLAIEWASHPQ